MTEEKALKRFAQCYNRRDFSSMYALLYKKATYESWDHFYKYRGPESVSGALGQKAASLREEGSSNRAYLGFQMVKREIFGRRCDPCVILTKEDPRKIIGVVRIKCTLFRIRHIRIYDPKGLQITRGDYVD